MTSLLTIGECMMELREQSDHLYFRSFAGDTYNSAVYAKRWCPQLSVAFLSAIGKGSVSSAMKKHWSLEGIDSSLVMESESANPGIYVVNTDQEGERSFSYWRQDSAATQLMSLIEEGGGAGTIAGFDAVYFSGISLAIFNDRDKAALLSLIESLRNRGAMVAFDPNYRAKMWPDLEQARYWMQRAYQVTDIAFPGLEDHQALFSHRDQSTIEQYLSQFGIGEMVIKCGSQGVYCYAGNEAIHLPFKPADKQVDTTAAGDSFAGVYLATRLAGKSVDTSVQEAADVAAYVVQHQGAIVDAKTFTEFRESRGN